MLKPIKRATIHKSYTESQLKVHRSLVAWEGTHQNSSTSAAKKRRVSKVSDGSSRTEMLFVWRFSTPYWERIFADSGAHCTSKADRSATTGKNPVTLGTARVKCKIGYDGDLIR